MLSQYTHVSDIRLTTDSISAFTVTKGLWVSFQLKAKPYMILIRDLLSIKFSHCFRGITPLSWKPSLRVIWAFLLGDPHNLNFIVKLILQAGEALGYLRLKPHDPRFGRFVTMYPRYRQQIRLVNKAIKQWDQDWDRDQRLWDRDETCLVRPRPKTMRPRPRPVRLNG